MADTNSSADLARYLINTGQLMEGWTVHTNISQNIIMVTEAEARLCLIEHLRRIGTKRMWLTPAGILLTIAFGFPTTTFHSFLSVSADVWMALFLLFALASFLWLGWAVYQAISASTSIDNVIDELKGATGAQVLEDVGLAQLRADTSLATDPDSLVIHSAKYGKEGWADVTRVLRDSIAAGRLDIQVLTENLGGDDPIKGARKDLVVVYSYGGSRFTKTYRERERLSLPEV